MNHIFNTYSKEILAYHLSGQKPAEQAATIVNPAETAEKHLRFAQKRGAEAIILFGIGDGILAQAIAEKKSEDLELLACALHPEQIRKLLQAGHDKFSNNPGCVLLTDSSIWALLLLLIQAGYSPTKSHLILNPGLQGESMNSHRNLQKLFSGTKHIQQPETPAPCTISAGAILSPDEPELENFMKNIPGWINEIVLIWDCGKNDPFPELEKYHDSKIINVRHPLNSDFSAQRNCMLKNCSGDWVIYLDADERLDEEGWEQIRRIPSFQGCDNWYLPRMTFYPDLKHCRVGYGLWPDLQLRFFKNTGNLKFINKIHERLTGMQSSSGILQGCPIQHLTHILKSREIIESKLENFNSSTGGRFKHRLGNDFPHIPKELLNPRKDCNIGPIQLPDINLA
jgi:hypothetical protein